MQKLILVTQLDSMDVDANIEGLIPVLFESVQGLKDHLTDLVNQRVQKFLDIEHLKPSAADEALYSESLFMDDAEVEASPSHLEASKRCESYYLPYGDICLSQQSVDINGTKVNISRFLGDDERTPNLPEIMTMEEWFDSRLPRFQVEQE
jgi:hypothetical protein